MDMWSVGAGVCACIVYVSVCVHMNSLSRHMTHARAITHNGRIAMDMYIGGLTHFAVIMRLVGIYGTRTCNPPY